MITVAGWTTEEIAVAKAHYSLFYKDMIGATTENVKKLKAWWYKERNYDPRLSCLAGVEWLAEWEWADAVVSHGTNQNYEIYYSGHGPWGACAAGDNT